MTPLFTTFHSASSNDVLLTCIAHACLEATNRCAFSSASAVLDQQEAAWAAPGLIPEGLARPISVIGWHHSQGLMIFVVTLVLGAICVALQ